ncbi:MAG: hypothetical protein KC415_23740 [Anaerolineales bacterium]|nr:hypothetical protein [Anaerolineales bacterium]MCB8991057.1 hypothetical protein [Ardenticatenaceae bacterium]MCB9004099.1 hypothetical protein [Ardenticatenaceae bacterium]
MAKIVQAVRQYGPKLRYGRMAELDEVVEWMSQRTGLNKGEVLLLLAELHEAILYFNRNGRGIKLPEIGIFSPGIDRHGVLRHHFRADVQLKKQMARRHEYYGDILHKSRIGWTDAQYKAFWDAAHPDDPLDV